MGASELESRSVEINLQVRVSSDIRQYRLALSLTNEDDRIGPPNKIQTRVLPFMIKGSDIIAQAPPTTERIIS